jgi:hypothetical protein
VAAGTVHRCQGRLLRRQRPRCCLSAQLRRILAERRQHLARSKTAPQAAAQDKHRRLAIRGEQISSTAQTQPVISVSMMLQWPRNCALCLPTLTPCTQREGVGRRSLAIRTSASVVGGSTCARIRRRSCSTQLRRAPSASSSSVVGSAGGGVSLSPDGGGGGGGRSERSRSSSTSANGACPSCVAQTASQIGVRQDRQAGRGGRAGQRVPSHWSVRWEHGAAVSRQPAGAKACRPAP